MCTFLMVRPISFGKFFFNILVDYQKHGTLCCCMNLDFICILFPLPSGKGIDGMDRLQFACCSNIEEVGVMQT